MTKKNAQKVAARARQARMGGSYMPHYRQSARRVVGVDEQEPAPIELDEPRFPDDEFEGRLEDETPEVAEMCRWFFARFEDPAQGVPHDSGEGGYQYVLGGPNDPADELMDAFPEADPSHIERACELIYPYGGEWVPTGLY